MYVWEQPCLPMQLPTYYVRGVLFLLILFQGKSRIYE